MNCDNSSLLKFVEKFYLRFKKKRDLVYLPQHSAIGSGE